MERTEVDHWLSFAIGPLKCSKSFTEALDYLERSLVLKTWLVAKRLTIADLSVFSVLHSLSSWKENGETYPNVTRWYKQVVSLPATKTSLAVVETNAKPAVEKSDKASKMTKAPKSGSVRKEEGKFIDLPGAEIGKVSYLSMYDICYRSFT